MSFPTSWKYSNIAALEAAHIHLDTAMELAEKLARCSLASEPLAVERRSTVIRIDDLLAEALRNIRGVLKESTKEERLCFWGRFNALQRISAREH